MSISIPFCTILASGSHGYLYGLFFLIVCLAIGAASKHFLKIFPQIPLPFTVFLLIIGLIMGALNRPFHDRKENGHSHAGKGAHGQHGEAKDAGHSTGAHKGGHADGHSDHHGKTHLGGDSKSHGSHGADGAPGAPLQEVANRFDQMYRAYLKSNDPNDTGLLMTQKELLLAAGDDIESKDGWAGIEKDFPGLRAIYLSHKKGVSPSPAATIEPATPLVPIPPVPEKDPPAGAHAHEEHGGHGSQGLFAKILEYLQEAILWGSKMDPHLILYVFLPVLIFEAAFALDMHTFKKSVENAFWMAGPGIITATLMTGVLFYMCLGMPGMEGWKNFDLAAAWKDAPPSFDLAANMPSPDAMAWFLCMLLGGIISATDPVAVVALLKELGASKKLGTLIEGESLLNDGTAIVAFVVLMEVIVGQQSFSILPTATGPGAALGFLKIGAAGAVVGGLIGLTTAAWVKRVFNDPEIEIAVIMVGSFLTFYAAETFLGVSGVLGLVAMGAVMASFGRTRISPEVEHFLHEFIEFAAFICNVLIFIIVGVVIAQNVSLDNLGSDLVILGIIYVIIHAVRAVNMLIFYPRMKHAGYGLPGKDSVVVWWGALRGAIGLALALVVWSPTLHSGDPNPIPEGIRDQFLFFVSGVVLLTLLVNATTIKALVNALGLTKIPAVKALMMGQAAQMVEQGAENEMEILKNDRFMSGANWGRVRNYLPDMEVPDISEEDKANMDTLAEARRRLLEKEKASYWNQFGEGLLGAQAVNALSGNVSEVLDLDGMVPLTERDYLKTICGSPSFFGVPMEFLQNAPILGRTFSDRLAAAYDAAKGFVLAQDEVKKLVDSLNLGDEADSTDIRETLGREINDNRLVGLGYIKDMQEKYPDVTVSIETKQAIRSLLNYERATIKKMKKQGAIEGDEASRMLEDVEKRMKDIADESMKLKMPTSQDVLREVSWLQGLPAAVVDKIANIAQEKTYQANEKVMSQGDSGDGLIVITRGSVRVSIGERVVDILGRGSVIGEMAVLADIPRTANVTADTGVTAVWLSSSDMQAVMVESKELSESLWRTAGARFAENELGSKDPYLGWTQMQLRRWISEGRVERNEESTRLDLYGKVAILIDGRATVGEGTVVDAPAHLDAAAAQLDAGSRVFICSSV